jgi:hypothetical protein
MACVFVQKLRSICKTSRGGDRVRWHVCLKRAKRSMLQDGPSDARTSPARQSNQASLIVIGLVEAARTSQRRPLLYFARQYCSFTPLDALHD